jgi:lysophosphatidylcholine acyltransferase/lyso-PAF acetyltransferase
MFLMSRKLKILCFKNMLNGCCSLKLLWLTLTQVHSSCEIEFLPVYTPNEEEKHDPKLYANNVRRLMAKYVQLHVWISVENGSTFLSLWYSCNQASSVGVCCRTLGIPVSDYTYDDCRLMTKAKRMNLPFASGLVEVQKLRQKLG